MKEENQPTAVLVTGASGYIAMHCVLQLLQQGYRVRGTLRSPDREKGLRDTFARHIDADHRLEFVTADLTSDQGWAAAARDCRFVLHVASPNSHVEPKDENAWVAPARDGTLRVLQAALDAGVQRVVLTSSIATIVHGNNTEGKIFTEEDWSNTDINIGAYSRSKTLAERAAWDFVNGLPAGQKLELAVINPSYVIGPILDERKPASVEIVGKLLYREVPGSPRLSFPLVDVRDVAAAHLLAMTTPQAAGERFICSAELYWMQEIANILHDQYAGRGYNIPTRQIPDIVARLIALFDGTVRRVIPLLGVRIDLSTDHLKNTLNWRPRSIKSSIIETAESLIQYDS